MQITFKNSDSLERSVKFEDEKVMAVEKAEEKVQRKLKDAEHSKERKKKTEVKVDGDKGKGLIILHAEALLSYWIKNDKMAQKGQ